MKSWASTRSERPNQRPKVTCYRCQHHSRTLLVTLGDGWSLLTLQFTAWVKSSRCVWPQENATRSQNGYPPPSKMGIQSHVMVATLLFNRSNSKFHLDSNSTPTPLQALRTIDSISIDNLIDSIQSRLNLANDWFNFNDSISITQIRVHCWKCGRGGGPEL